MKRISTLVFVLCVVLIAASMPVMAVSAFDGTPPPVLVPASPPTLDQLLTSLLSLGGFAAFVAALNNAGKKLGLVPDGKAGAVSLVLNLVGLVGLAGLQLAGRADLIPVLDANAGSIAQALTAVVALVFQLYISRTTHTNVLAGMPLVGKSHSERQAGQGIVAELVVGQG
jgi:hypothetical protein